MAGDPNSAVETAAWVQRIAGSDRRAEEELIRFFQPRVIAFVAQRIRHRATAEEAVQDVLWAVIRALREGKVNDQTFPPMFMVSPATASQTPTAKPRVIATASGQAASILLRSVVDSPLKANGNERRRKRCRPWNKLTKLFFE